jgi:hypothetical protein
MLNVQQLDAMSRIDIAEADRDNLVDIASIRIDPDLPAVERMESYIGQVKNPYLFRSGDTVVRVRFDPNGAKLGDVLKRHFIGLKRA